MSIYGRIPLADHARASGLQRRRGKREINV